MRRGEGVKLTECEVVNTACLEIGCRNSEVLL